MPWLYDVSFCTLLFSIPKASRLIPGSSFFVFSDMLNALTIDLEDYFQVNAFSKIIPFQDWGNYECRIERNTHRLLEILSDSGKNPQSEICNRILATFFILGWIAERYPGLIREIKRQGHEIASHGYDHQMISSVSPKQFREDVHRSKCILEDLTGAIVLGYRAPTFSITYRELWAIEILVKAGYRYDCSIFPVRHDTYGFPDAPRFPFRISLKGDGKVEFSPIYFMPGIIAGTSFARGLTPGALSLIEFPPSTIRLYGMNFPISGGGYFRLLPYPLIKRGLQRINRKENQPFIFYIHPWEIDPEQPRIRGARIKAKFRHYINLDKNEEKFVKLLTDFKFSSIQGISK